jgi:O-antigen/teichoic acid export membrane protein
MVGLALTADLLVALVLGDAWKPVGPLIQLLSLFGLLSAAFVLNASILLGIGRSDIEFRGTVMRTCGVAAGVVAGLAFKGSQRAFRSDLQSPAFST